MVFSKGHFSDPNCVHLQAGSGATSTVFEIQNNQCGMTSSGGFQSDNGQPNPAGSFIESTIIVQYDPLVQEVFDQARKLRCTWYDYYEKSVTFRPFQVRFVLLVSFSLDQPLTKFLSSKKAVSSLLHVLRKQVFGGFDPPHSPLSSKVSICHDPLLVLRKVFLAPPPTHTKKWTN